MEILTTHNLSIGYGSHIVQKGLSLTACSGQLVCVLGVNGCGKSTLFRTLAALQPSLGGTITIAGKRLDQMGEAERARHMSIVLTDRVDADNMSVHDIVALGRYPYSSWLGGLSDDDERHISQSLSMVHLDQLSHRFYSQLSDGEAQRVMIAKALAQDTPLILLDEPTAHLDLPNRMQVMLLLRQLARKTHKAILLSTHELDLALQAADRLWLMRPHAPITCGLPEDLVLSRVFQSVFASDSFTFDTANGNFVISHEQQRPARITGDTQRSYWTVRALARVGIYPDPAAADTIHVTDTGWEHNGQSYATLEELIASL